MSAELIPALKARLRQQVLAVAGAHAQRCRWFALAGDGSRIETPHTAANEEGLGCAGREKTAPQVFATTLWHMGTGLPWDFCMGRGTSSERGHLAEMIPETPEGCLLVADAGFAGYELLRGIIESKRKLLSRTPATCLAEAQWTMLGLWLLGLMTVRTLIAQDVDPLQMSVAAARDAVRRAMRSVVRGKPHARRLALDLRAAVKDHYPRRGSKTARNYPRKKRETPPGPPKIKPATLSEIQRAKRIREELATLRRTA